MLKWPFPSRPKAPEPPKWDEQHPQESLEGLRQYVEEQARREIVWYGKGARRTRRFSRTFRSLALTFTALGGLVPVLSSMGILKPAVAWLADAGRDFEVAHLGYFFLAVAGSFALFDRFFGFSSA